MFARRSQRIPCATMFAAFLIMPVMPFGISRGTVMASEVIETPVVADGIPNLKVKLTPIDIAGGGAPRGVCGTTTRTYSTANFSGGSFVMQAGMVEEEVAAASYTVPSSEFPILFNVGEIVWVQQGATVATTTQWSFLVWEGTPDTGTLVGEFNSDDLIIPHIHMTIGTQGTLVQASVDPGDPEQIIIQNNGTSTFSVGFRIDQHNNPPIAACDFGFTPAACCPPATNSNAFPTTDTPPPGVPNFQLDNWLKAKADCGPFACPSGWRRFSQMARAG